MDLEASTQSRKARLDALKASKSQANSLKRNREGTGEDSSETPTLKFRNYIPKTLIAPQADSEMVDIRVSDATSSTAEVTIKQLKTVARVEKELLEATQAAANSDEALRGSNLDVFNLAPKKANFDLKRELTKRGKRLESKYRSCVEELVRKRIASEGGVPDLVGGPNGEVAPRDDEDDGDGEE